MDVIVFDVDVEAVLLQEAGHTQLQFADVLLHLVVRNSWERSTDGKNGKLIVKKRISFVYWYRGE